jgi:hypothetical protein
MDRSFRAGRSRLAGVVRCLAPIALALGLAQACTQLRGSLGDDCLKNQDCLSNVCAQLHCVATPPLLDAAPSATTASEGGADATSAATDGATPADGEADDAADVVQPDVTEGVEDAPVDSPVTVPDASAPDAPSDAPSDGPLDAAHLDGGEAG